MRWTQKYKLGFTLTTPHQIRNSAIYWSKVIYNYNFLGILLAHRIVPNCAFLCLPLF